MNQAKAIGVLTILFYLLAAATVALYFLFPENRMPMFYAGFGAIGVRLVTYLLRHFL